MLLQIVSLITSFADMFILITYFSFMFYKKKRPVHISLYLLGFIFMEILLLLLNNYMLGVQNTFRIFLFMGVSIFTTFCLTYYYISTIRHRIFTVLLFQFYAATSELVTAVIMPIANIEQSRITEEDFDIIGLFCSKLLLFLLVALTNVFVNKRKHIYSNQYNLLILLTPAVSTIIILTLPYPGSEDIGKSIVLIISMSGILVLNLANFFLLNNILEVLALKEKEKYLEKQIEIQAEKYKQISASYRSTRSILHDTKKHFFFIQECIHKQGYETILSYLETATNDLEKSYSHINTGNLVIDSFLSHHMEICKNSNIEVIHHIQIVPEKIHLDDYDLCIVLGNLLDNCYNACKKLSVQKEKRIRIYLSTDEKHFTIHLKNTFEDSSQTEFSNPLHHGFGLNNIKRIVTKYHGSYSCSITDDIYESIVVFPIHTK